MCFFLLLSVSIALRFESAVRLLFRGREENLFVAHTLDKETPLYYYYFKLLLFLFDL